MNQTVKDILIYLAAQTPIVLAVFVGWGTITQHPIISFVIFCLYELILVFRGYAKKVWQLLEPKFVEASAGLIETTTNQFFSWLFVIIQNRFSRFEQAYNTQLIYDHRVFNVSGLTTKGSHTLEVEQVFVELGIARSNPQHVRRDLLSIKEGVIHQPIWDYLRQLDKHEAIALAIIGPPGSGKTTLLQHIVLTLATNKHKKFKIKAYRPLFLFLREHVDTIVTQNIPLADLAQNYFTQLTRYPNPPPQWFERQLSFGNCLVLLDGLDEVAEAKQRQFISKWVDEQIRTYPHSIFVLTSRPQGYANAPLKQVQLVEVQPFTAEQVKKFTYNWYIASKIISYGKDDLGVRQDAEKQAQDLLRRLQHRPRLNDLTVNPLLLTMIAMVHNHRNVLPGSRAELYSEICDVLLGHWRRSIGIVDSLNASQKRAVLQPLAAYMMQQDYSIITNIDRIEDSEIHDNENDNPNIPRPAGVTSFIPITESTSSDGQLDRRTITTEKAMEIITPYLELVGLPKEEHDLFLPRLQASSGLILEREIGLWSFAHLTFQEYLCSVHWHETQEAESWSLEKWKQLVTDSWWHETLRLYIAQSDGTKVAEACLAVDTISTLTLADEIQEEARKLDINTRHAINDRLQQSLESSDSNRRKLAAEVYLNRRLRTTFQGSLADEDIAE